MRASLPHDGPHSQPCPRPLVITTILGIGLDLYLYQVHTGRQPTKHSCPTLPSPLSPVGSVRGQAYVHAFLTQMMPRCRGAGLGPLSRPDLVSPESRNLQTPYPPGRLLEPGLGPHSSSS